MIRAVQGDITALKVDAIVNAANSTLLGGGGVDGAIHRAAGPELKAYCTQLGGCPTGEAKITPGFRLPAKYIIHTVGPVWSDGSPELHDDLLASCYQRSLDLAAGVGARSVAFPNISTGVYGFPKDRAAAVAVAAVRDWIRETAPTGAELPLEQILFVCFDAENHRVYQRLLP